LTDKVQFMTLCTVGLLEVYACAWPADYLIDVVSCISMTFISGKKLYIHGHIFYIIIYNCI